MVGNEMQVQAGSAVIEDLLVQLGIGPVANGDESGETIAEILSRAVLDAAAKVETPLDDIARRIHAAQVAKGFWPSKTENSGEERNFGEAIALITSELSEALDEHRSGRALVWFADTDYKPEGVAVELADAVIRTFDYLGFLAEDLEKEFGMTIDDLFELKSKYNATRPAKHGKRY